jgi:2-C-methyl-D-erythritol 4-phosphate cytidylyltransferase
MLVIAFLELRKTLMESNHPESTTPVIDQKRIEYLLHQQNLYQAAKPQLLQQYQGLYVAFENGAVLDSDPDDRQLMPRLYAKYGHRDIFVEYVCDPEPQLSVSAAGHVFPVK